MPLLKEAGLALVGFIVAPVFPAAAFSLFSYGVGVLRFASWPDLFVTGYVYALAFSVIFGLPAFLILRPFRPGHWWSVAAAGFLLGTLVLFILGGPRLPEPDACLLMGSATALSTLAFWSIWKLGADMPANTKS